MEDKAEASSSLLSSESEASTTIAVKLQNNQLLPLPLPTHSSPRSPLTRTESLDDSLATQRESNVFNFVINVPKSSLGPLLRSNSYTLQDVTRQRKNIQESVEANLCDDDPIHGMYHTLSQKGRRMSKSLPELRDVRHLSPTISMKYHSIAETDEDDDDSVMVHDIPVKLTWSSKTDFVFTGVGLALGLNNLWRFPYFCYKFGSGGSFFVVYLFLMFAFCFPMLCYEYAVGQLTRHGPIVALGSLCPLLKGVAIVAAVVCFLLAPLYSAINSWSLFYFFKSFYSKPLWFRCTNQWNSPSCHENRSLTDRITLMMNNTASPFIESVMFENETMDATNETDHLGIDLTTDFASYFNFTATHLLYPTQQFFDHKLLELNLEAPSLGTIRWELTIFAFVTWLSVFISLRKNILFSSHPTYCLAIVPYLVLVVLFGRSLTLEGSKQGIVYLMKPSWEGTLNPEVWLYAAALCFHSLGNVLGTSYAKAACNKERNNFLRDALIICLVNAITVTAIGCTIFGTLGYLSIKRQTPISELLPQDPGLAFVVFSELLASMPFTALWSVVFFLTIFCVGTDYQIAIVGTFLAAVEDAYGATIKRKFISHQIFILVLCVVLYLFTLAFITQKGILLIQLVDQYITVLLTVILAFFEAILIGWFYGGNSLAKIIRLKLSKSVGCYFPFSWNIVSPFGLLIILGLNAYSYQETVFRNASKFPPPMLIVVHVVVIISLLIIPLVAYIQITKTPKTTIVNRILTACKPREETNDRKEHLDFLESSFNGQQRIAMLPSNQPNLYSDLGNNANKYQVTLSRIQGLDRETDI